MAMSRIAIAGTGGLAIRIAASIHSTTSHPVILLSRREQDHLTQAGFQIVVVNYANPDSLRFALRGIDTVISTVTGPNQIALIRAALVVSVRRFAPAEFEGLLAGNDPADHSRALARQLLVNSAPGMESAFFVCGIFYERFQPGGLAVSRIGASIGLLAEGDYIMNCRTMTAPRVPAFDANGQPVTICMTELGDVARFVTRALELPRWQGELRMFGQRMRITDLLTRTQQLLGRNFDPVALHGPHIFREQMQLAVAQRNAAEQARLRALIRTAEGCYDFPTANLNDSFRDIRPRPFHDWLRARLLRPT